MEPEPSFEDALRHLETIVDDLERGDTDLSAALASYQEGVRLLARCHAELDRAGRSVALLTGTDDDGEPTTAPFDASATAPAETPAAPKKRTSRSAPLPDSDLPF